MGWLALGIAIGAEVIATIALKESRGLARPLPVIVVVIGYGAAFWLLSVALRHVSLSLSYAIWSGVGTAFIALVGILHYGESAAAVRLAGLACIVVGCVLVNLRA